MTLCLSLSLLPPPTLCISTLALVSFCFFPQILKTPLKAFEQFMKICAREMNSLPVPQTSKQYLGLRSAGTLLHWQEVEGSLKLKNHSFESEMLVQGCLSLSNDKLGNRNDKWSLKYQRNMKHFISQNEIQRCWTNYPSVSTVELILQRLLSDQRKTHCIYLSQSENAYVLPNVWFPFDFFLKIYGTSYNNGTQ